MRQGTRAIQKLLALLLSLALCAGLLPAAALADDTERDTDFFTPREHADLDFADMEYVAVDTDAILAQMDAVRALSADAANTEAVREGFLAAREDLITSVGMYELALIYSSLDSGDDARIEDEIEAEEAMITIDDAFRRLARDIAASPCAGALEGIVPEEDLEALAEYRDLTEEELALSAQLTELENRYWRESAAEYTIEADGVAMTEDDILDAYYSGEIDYDQYWEWIVELARVRNEALGAIYMEMLPLRRREAEIDGYEDFLHYAYEDKWGYDFTPEDIQAFHAATKEYIVPLYLELSSLVYSSYMDGLNSRDYSGDITLDMMEPYVSALSDELAESFRYMRSHGLYDIGPGENKTDQGYTISLDNYNSAFFYNYPYGDFHDFKTAVHEFGHYNNAYWRDLLWDGSDISISVAEVHSQGLELLFTHFYPELFGADSDAAALDVISDILYSIVQGALFDELQQYVYTAGDGVTLSDINRKYRELAGEYGFTEPDDPREEMYSWVDIQHSFGQPLYYISYAVSAAGAFAFWLEAQEDYFSAVDTYLSFTAQPTELGFLGSFEAVGVPSPIAPAYLETLAETLAEVLDVDGRLENLPVVGYYTDVTRDYRYWGAIYFAYMLDLIDGLTPTTFGPEEPMKRSDVVHALYMMDGAPDLEGTPAVSFSDVGEDSPYLGEIAWAVENGIVNGYGNGAFGIDDPVTREQLAVMLWRYLALDGEEGDLSDYPDAAKVNGWAAAAVSWAFANGFMEPDEAGAIAPQTNATRGEAAWLLLAWLLTDDSEEPEDAGAAEDAGATEAEALEEMEATAEEIAEAAA